MKWISTLSDSSVFYGIHLENIIMIPLFSKCYHRLLFQSTFLTASSSATSTIIKPARKRNNSQRREELAGGAPRAASPALETRCPAAAPPAAARTCARLRSKAVGGASDLHRSVVQTLQGSFSAAAAVDRTIFKNSAVSTPNFASKHSFESS